MTPLRHHGASDEERVENRTKPLLQDSTSGTKTSDDEPNYSAGEELVGGDRNKKSLLAASDDPLSHGMNKMPRCPMSTYNHFFQFEQQLLIHELVSSSNLTSSSSLSTVGSLRSLSSRASAVSNADGCLESFVRNLPARYQPVAERIHQRHCEDELMRNMGFLELSRNIAERWRMLDEETKQFFVEKANDDMLRYRLEWKDYTVRQLSLGRKCLWEKDDDDEADVLEGNSPDSLIPPPRRPSSSSSSSSSSPLVIVADTVKSDSVPNACQETLLRRVSSGCNSLDIEGHAVLSSAASAARRTTGNSSTEDLLASTDADATTGGIKAHNLLNRDGFDGGNYPHHCLANATNQYRVRHIGRTHMPHSPRISDMKRNATKQTPLNDSPPFEKWTQESRQVPQHCRALQHPIFHHRAGVVWEGYHHQMRREGVFPNQPYQWTVSNKKLTPPLEGTNQGYMPPDSRSSYVDQHFDTRARENQFALQQSREQKESVLNVPPPPLNHHSHDDNNTSVSSSVTTRKIEFEPETKIDMQSSAVVDCRPGLAYLAAVAQSQFKRCEDQSISKKSNEEKGNREGKKHLEKEKQSSCQQDAMKKEKKKEDQASFTEGCAVKEESRKRKCPSKEDNSNGTGKILQKPIKPPSAYNLFFQLERDRLLESTPGPTSIGRFPVVSNVPYHMMKDDPRVPKRFRQLVQKRAATTPEIAPLDPSKKPRRRHRKTHGKFGFIELSKLIASEWKSSDQETKNFFNSISQTLKSRYYFEIAAYKKQQLMLRKTESKPSDS